MNLPNSRLQIPALTHKDLADLPFIAEHAHMVGLSFVNRARDVHALHAALDRTSWRKPGVVLKIETQRAFRALRLASGVES